MSHKLIEIAFRELKYMFSKLARLAKESISVARSCLEACGSENLEKLISLSKEAHRVRVDIFELASEIIARFQPVARDLRLVQAYISASYDLYRLCRYSFEIGRTLSILEVRCSFEKAANMWNTVVQMFDEAIAALVEMDEDKASRVLKLDEIVDKAYVEGLASLKQATPTLCDIAEALILRHLERMADHLTYIASETLYVVKGSREYL